MILKQYHWCDDCGNVPGYLVETETLKPCCPHCGSISVHQAEFFEPEEDEMYCPNCQGHGITVLNPMKDTTCKVCAGTGIVKRNSIDESQTI